MLDHRDAFFKKKKKMLVIAKRFLKGQMKSLHNLVFLICDARVFNGGPRCLRGGIFYARNRVLYLHVVVWPSFHPLSVIIMQSVFVMP